MMIFFLYAPSQVNKSTKLCKIKEHIFSYIVVWRVKCFVVITLVPVLCIFGEFGT